MFSNKEIGNRIFETRNKLGLTLDDIAARVGVAKSTIQRYEKGDITRIKLPVIESIANALDVNPNWLIGNVDDPLPISSSFSNFPKRLNELCMGFGYKSVDDFARSVGVPSSLISEWESGDKLPSPDRLVWLCDYFHVTPDDLLGMIWVFKDNPISAKEHELISAWRQADEKDRRIVAAALEDYGFSYTQDTDNSNAG